MQQWHSDTLLCVKFGDAWTESMSLHNNATMQMNVATANEWLAREGYSERVLDCRAAEDDNELEWLCNWQVVVS